MAESNTKKIAAINARDNSQQDGSSSDEDDKEHHEQGDNLIGDAS